MRMRSWYSWKFSNWALSSALSLAFILSLLPLQAVAVPEGGASEFRSLLGPKAEEVVAATPEVLKPWIPWVVSRHRTLSCGSIRGESRCLWSRQLSLSVGPRGGSFALEGIVFDTTAVTLPGGVLIAPLEVRGKDGELLPVAVAGGVPKVTLPKGAFSLRGVFKWDEMPKSMQIPSDIALLGLEVQGRKIESPQLSDRGELWLVDRQDSGLADQDTVEASVFRRLEDGAPFQIETAVYLRVSGKIRELVLGNILPPESTLVEVQSELPVRYDSERGVVVQARPGRYQVRFRTLLQTPPAQLAVPDWTLPDFSGEEVWVWKPNEEVRSVRLSGGVSIDSSRTELPAEWKGLTTLALSQGQHVNFEEVRRGELDAGSNALSLNRTVWLPLSGGDLLVRDSITGRLNRDWRLDAEPELQVGRASIGGQDQLITKAPSGEGVGIEIRQQGVSLLAESKLRATLAHLPVVSWKHPMEQVSLTVNLPPGWEVLHASGADAVSQTWVGSWSLLDVFLLLLVAIATSKLVSRVAGITVLIGLALLHGQAGSPQLIYFHLLAAFALVRFLPESNFKAFVRFHYAATLVLFAVLVATFSFHHLIQAIFPSVLPPGSNLYGFLEPFFFLVEGTFSGWIMFTLFVWGAQLFFTGSFFSGIVYGVAGIALMMVVSASASFTGVGGTMYQGQFFNDVAMTRSYMEMDSSSLSVASAPYEGEMRSKRAFKALQTFDPNAVVQTGPGLPEWSWSSVSLSWNGQVEPGYETSIWAMGPTGFLIVSFVRVFVLVFLLWVFLQRSSSQWWKSLAHRVSPVAVSVLSLCGALGFTVSFVSIAQAQEFPSDSLLQQLEERLLGDICTKDCSTINSLALGVQGDQVVGELRVSSDGVGAVALPGPHRALAIESVQLDGEPLRALRRESDGTLWARVPTGEHSIRVVAKLRSREVATIQFPMNPQHVEVVAPEYLIDGVSPTGAVRESLQLTRKAPMRAGEKGATDADIEVASWFEITRSVAIGLPWELSTRVRRIGNRDRPEILSLKLLNGESVVSAGFNVKDSNVEVHFQRGVESLEWNSTLKPVEQLELTADRQARVSEEWEIRCSTLWSCVVSGLAPERSVLDGASGWMFRPYPGDRVSVSVSRPLGAPGQSSTVERVRHQITPGVRSLSGALTLTMRASQGGTQSVVLPDGASLQRVVIDGTDETTRFSGNALQIPVKPGASTAQVEYLAPDSRGMVLRVPKIGLEGTVANVSTVISAPPERWLLFAFGPGFGPAVLFWAKLLVVVLFALVLGRVGLEPLGTRAWILLGLGLATLPIPLMLVPVLWVWLLGWRKEKEISSAFRFNAVQVGLAILTLIVLMLLYRAVETGLILSPDMFVRGQQSDGGELTWYVDYSAEGLPQPMIISVPMWIWRAVMLAWSMWLVFAVIRWLRWAFECLSQGGLWKSGKPPQTGDSSPSPASSGA